MNYQQNCKAVAEKEFDDINATDLFFAGGGQNFSFFSAAVIFWLLFDQAKSDKI